MCAMAYIRLAIASHTSRSIHTAALASTALACRLRRRPVIIALMQSLCMVAFTLFAGDGTTLKEAGLCSSIGLRGVPLLTHKLSPDQNETSQMFTGVLKSRLQCVTSKLHVLGQVVSAPNTYQTYLQEFKAVYMH